MAVYKEINRADGSGVTTFYRISDILDTAETDDKESQSVVIDYNQAQNKPSINGVALVGNKTSENLGLQPAGDYITNNEADEKFIDEDELEAKNYVNQTELQDAIAHIEHFHREIVEALPVTGMDNVLYMVRKGGTGEDIYNEYIWVGLSNSENGYEFLGTTATDLTDYYKKSQVDAALATKVDKEGGKGLSEENYTLAEKTKLAGLKNYDDTEIQAEVSGLNTDMNNLKKSNITISNTLAELKPDVDSNTAAVSTIYDLLDNKMTAIRLVEQGDGWVWMNLEGSRLTYAQASAALGHENCMLFIEQLENDGKVIPAEHKSEGDHINIIFKDLDSLVHIMTCGEDDVVVTKDVTTTNGQVDFTVEDEAIGYTTKMTALYGKSTQATTTGKNLAKITDVTETLGSGLNYTAQNGEIKLNGTLSSNLGTSIGTLHLEANTDYYFSINNSASLNDSYLIINDNGTYIYFGVNKTFQVSQTKDYDLTIVLIKGTYNNLILKPQAELGTTKTSWEPYTGGQPSPSPDYPSEIECVKDTIQVKDVGKNLLENTGVSNTINGITFTVNDDKTILANGNNDGTANSRFIINNYFLKAGTYILNGCPSGGSSTTYRLAIQKTSDWSILGLDTGSGSKQFTIDEATKIQVAIFIQKGQTISNLLFKPMIRLSSIIDDAYEPYQSSSSLFVLDQPLRSLPNGVKDELVIENGRAKIIKRIGKVVLDGSEAWIKLQIGSTGKYYFQHTPSDLGQVTSNSSVLSNYFVQSTTWSEQSVGIWFDKNLIIKTEGSLNNTETVDDFKTWLSTHNVEVYYALETPIDIEITDPTLLAQLDALEQITQYKHTYITITGDDLTPEADFTYINNVVINNTDSVLGKDTYWNDEVPTQQDLPSKAQEGEIRIVQDTEDIYIYNGTKWVPFDKNSEVDLSNYLTKDNTTPWVPTGPFNPSTKKYVDDSVGGIHVPTKTSQLQNDSGFVIKTTNELTNYYTKNNTYTKNEVDALVAGGSGASDYSDLTNKPKINNVELSGNKSLSDLGIINLNNVLDGKAIGSARTIGAKDSEGQPLGEYAWAEGKNTIASGNKSHAEGVNTKALGDYSHTEGLSTTASGDYSHAEGIGTIAQGASQHVQGKNNIADTTSAHIVGNGGSYSNKSNAHTLDWSGNAWFAGDVYTGSTSGTNKDEGSKILATKEYVDSKTSALQTQIFDLQGHVIENMLDAVIYRLSNLDNKSEFRFFGPSNSGVIDLGLSFEDVSLTSGDKFEMSATFQTASSGCGFSLIETDSIKVKLTGDDVTNGVLNPVANKVYEIAFYWNGFFMSGVVRGVEH